MDETDISERRQGFKARLPARFSVQLQAARQSETGRSTQSYETTTISYFRKATLSIPSASLSLTLGEHVLGVRRKVVHRFHLFFLSPFTRDSVMYARRRPLGTEDSAFEPVKDEDQSAVARPQIAALGGQLTAVTLNEGGQQPVRVFEPRVVASRPSVQTRRPRAPRATLSPMSAPEGSTLHDSTTLRNRSERDKSTMGAHSTSATAGDHPFLSTGFKASLMSAGYTEMIDVSRKKIKARFTHACGKLEVRQGVDFDRND